MAAISRVIILLDYIEVQWIVHVYTVVVVEYHIFTCVFSHAIFMDLIIPLLYIAHNNVMRNTFPSLENCTQRLCVNF